MANDNILSQRYATAAINSIFSEEGKIIAERELWITVMKAQRELGVDIPADAITRFEAVKNTVDLARIREIEQRTKHDVKARIQAFVETAQAPEVLHLGMTSRDLTDNVEQMQLRQAGQLLFGKHVAVLRHLLDKAEAYKHIELTARTHHQPAQLTLLGRRMAMWAEELHYHLGNFETFLNTYPLRGMKGAVGTQFDMLTLLGSPEKVQTLEQRVASLLGFSRVLDAPGQVYPRSLDAAFFGNVHDLSSGIANFAKGMRLMAGYELVTEGFKEGQVGSSAMPHKMNTPHAERIDSLMKAVKMYAFGAALLAGDQWEEGDVSCSVLRRIVLPDACYASDGLCETALDVIDSMGVYPAVITREVDCYLPFLATSEILMMAVKAGIGREQAHGSIKKHAVAEALTMRQEGKPPTLAARLADDPLFRDKGITAGSIESILADKQHFIGNAREQIAAVRAKAQPILTKYATQANYEPGDIL